MKFEISGSFRVGGKNQKFTREVSAKDEPEARERIYSLFGSEHGCKRRWIEISNLKKLG